MKGKFLIFALVFFALNCSQRMRGANSLAEKVKETNEKEAKVLSIVEDKTEANKGVKIDTIILSEDFINNIAIPFERKEMLGDLKESFRGFDVSKKTGQQDGPDFLLYSLKQNNENILFFGMDWEDSLRLNDIFIKSSIVKDEYGLKVGDGYWKIKELRTGEVKISTDYYHQHTYAYIDDSNISYEILGDVFLSDTADFENLKLTEEQTKDWTIYNLIWRKK